MALLRVIRVVFFRVFFRISYGSVRVCLDVIYCSLRVGLFQVCLRFVKLLAHGLKHCKLGRICFRPGSKSDFVTILGKRGNGTRFGNIMLYSQFAENTRRNNKADGIPAWNCVDRPLASPSDIAMYHCRWMDGSMDRSIDR